MARRKSSKSSKAQESKPAVSTVGSLRLLSEALKAHGVKRSHVALSKTVKDFRWRDAGFASSAPWPTKHLPAMAEFLSESLQEDRSREPADEEMPKDGGMGRATNLAKLKYIMEKTTSIKVSREIKQAKFVAREEAEAAAAAKWRLVKAALQQLPRALRQVLADATDAGKVEDILTGALRTLCDEAFEGGSNQ